MLKALPANRALNQGLTWTPLFTNKDHHLPLIPSPTLPQADEIKTNIVKLSEPSTHQVEALYHLDITIGDD